MDYSPPIRSTVRDASAPRFKTKGYVSAENTSNGSCGRWGLRQYTRRSASIQAYLTHCIRNIPTCFVRLAPSVQITYGEPISPMSDFRADLHTSPPSLTGSPDTSLPLNSLLLLKQSFA